MLRLLKRRRCRIVLWTLCTLVCLWFLASFLCVYLLTRRTQAPFAESAPVVPWGQIAALRLRTVDREELGAWFVSGPDSGPSILLLHGNGDSRRTGLPLAEFYARSGCSVLMISLRAHGDSTGEFNDIGYSARHDVAAAVDYLERRRPGRPILIQGTSLGAAAAIFAAAELGTRVNGYILECPYRDLRTAVSNRLEYYLPFPLDKVVYAGLNLTAPLVLPDLERMAPVDAIASIPPSVPVVLLAGRRDQLARPEEARALYRRVVSHGRLVWFERAGHESYYVNDPSLYREAVGQLITAVVSARTTLPVLATTRAR